MRCGTCPDVGDEQVARAVEGERERLPAPGVGRRLDGALVGPRGVVDVDRAGGPVGDVDLAGRRADGDVRGDMVGAGGHRRDELRHLGALGVEGAGGVLARGLADVDAIAGGGDAHALGPCGPVDRRHVRGHDRLARDGRDRDRLAEQEVPDRQREQRDEAGEEQQEQEHLPAALLGRRLVGGADAVRGELLGAGHGLGDGLGRGHQLLPSALGDGAIEG